MPHTATVAERFAALLQIRIITRAELREAGADTHEIAAGVRSGRLIRLRRGWYATQPVDDAVATAVRIGGRITCVSLLRMIGVFVLEKSPVHVHVSPGLSRSRHRRSATAVVHWGECHMEGTAHAVSIWDAVRQAVRCQTPRAAIATLDSVLHHRLMNGEDIVALFRSLPRRFQALLPLVDSSAESGPETFVRLMLRALGLSYETQVQVTGVGRVDFVVEGWLIIECDSREFHEGWDKQVEDRARDIAAARAGYMTIRPLASDIFDRPSEVKQAIADVVAALGPRLRSR